MAETIQVEEASVVLKLLGDKTRLTMLKLLSEHECCVCELVELFKISQSAISQHLRKLKDIKLVKEERRGQWIFYSINEHSDMYDLLQTVLQHIPDQSGKLTELEKSGLRIQCN